MKKLLNFNDLARIGILSSVFADANVLRAPQPVKHFVVEKRRLSNFFTQKCPKI